MPSQVVGKVYYISVGTIVTTLKGFFMKNTPLSDAIVLGASLVKLTPTKWLTSDDCGCFIGMAAKAIGITSCVDLMETIHPWLKNQSFPIPTFMLGSAKAAWYQTHGWQSVADPEGEIGIPSAGSLYGWQIITIMAFMVHDGSLSFDAAIAWIREHEPVMQAPEPTPLEAQVAQ